MLEDLKIGKQLLERTIPYFTGHLHIQIRPSVGYWFVRNLPDAVGSNCLEHVGNCSIYPMFLISIGG